MHAKTNEVAATFSVGKGSDSLGDMTGFSLLNITTRTGLWKVTYDSGKPYTPWQRISWNSEEPEGTRIVVRVRSSDVYRDGLLNILNHPEFKEREGIQQICHEILSRTVESDLTLLIKHIIPDGEHRD